MDYSPINQELKDLYQVRIQRQLERQFGPNNNNNNCNASRMQQFVCCGNVIQIEEFPGIQIGSVLWSSVSEEFIKLNL